MSCCIYKIENKINGMIYIGQSIHIEKRFKEHIKSNKYKIDKAIQDFGEKNFSYIIIEECSKDKLNEREIYWIKFYNSYKNGYNDTPGGQNADKAIEVTKKKVEQYSLSGDFIKEYESINEAARQTHIQESNIGYCCHEHPRYKHAGDYQWKIKDSNKQIIKIDKIHSTKIKSVIQIDKETGEVINIFSSSKEAWRQTGISYKHIPECCKGLRKSAGGYYWKYAEE